MLFWLLSLIGLLIIGIFIYGALLSLTCSDCDFLQRVAMFVPGFILPLIFIWGFAKQTKKVEISKDSIVIEEFSGKREMVKKAEDVEYRGGTIYGASLTIRSEGRSAQITNYSYFTDSDQMIRELEELIGKKIFHNPWLKR
jgi:hypothetical protein